MNQYLTVTDNKSNGLLQKTLTIQRIEWLNTGHVKIKHQKNPKWKIQGERSLRGKHYSTAVYCQWHIISGACLS